ncbi:dTDP-4-dehydrorhamnose reductase [Brachyspira hyodysenteriae]|uniref:dTDP-4-dehydrorhamnose reductase n=1 Tax=Brachyspira hyodysenteriae TaxID=159 RepID=F5CBN3_BRAHO|nr:dTDP-4-dehydrorhamnose reductase [Brachyspira hyodysenteriae]AEC11784.1 dTDP-4-keto-L-rhamnose reductase [Brachyspira hyodysenteriae]MCZ9852426.1 dTDP-4-dehydrorhamnose reductase [Brachyspira hyodysenteriae]MCZ9862037.1 dTDP-4-dehydrorhamnose reductase [Brachyspira hyodysenteriae]MCZ9871540.1 dTDP-4-dehydrorhamnose reductase [Brachyspira hyodysenteriae]MCZ9877193.1 dTDP-4-dehydrorhamnose reductase [Brachyspira hyodysenteriae]
MIWIIGKNGMLAQDILQVFNKNNIEYTSTASNIDITNIDILNNFIKDKNIKTIINCSAYTKVDLAEDEKDICYKVNGEGVKNITEIASNINADLIHFSTDYVFDGENNKPYNEEDKTNPINIYGKSKLEGEKYALSYNKSIVIRVSWLYGIYGKNFVYTMINLMNSKESIKVVNDQFGSPTYTEDVAMVIYDIIKNNNFYYGLYHYTNEGDISWYDFAKTIYNKGKEYNIINNDCKVNPCTTEEYPTKAKRPKYSVLSVEKIKRYVKIYNYEDSLNSFFNIYQKNK